jgi:hypothetical protein
VRERERLIQKLVVLGVRDALLPGQLPPGFENVGAQIRR